MAKIDIVLDRLERVRRTGEGRWVGCCPVLAHDDKSPSLAVRLVDNEKILLHCFGGCLVDDVVSALGLTLSDLMDNPTFSKPVKNRIPASDLLAFIHFEATIVLIAAFDLVSGKTPSEPDFARLLLAHERLEGAVRECCR